MTFNDTSAVHPHPLTPYSLLPDAYRFRDDARGDPQRECTGPEAASLAGTSRGCWRMQCVQRCVCEGHDSIGDPTLSFKCQRKENSLFPFTLPRGVIAPCNLHNVGLGNVFRNMHSRGTQKQTEEEFGPLQRHIKSNHSSHRVTIESRGVCVCGIYDACGIRDWRIGRVSSGDGGVWHVWHSQLKVSRNED